MRILFSILSFLFTAALCYVLDTNSVLKLPFGKFLSPQSGIWQNAESFEADFSDNLKFDQLIGKTNVYLDERLVPHVFAENESDAFFVQGYLHAKFRLWQMEFQTMYAAGRASEVVGDVALNHDREFRRLGLVYAAEKSLVEMENDPTSKMACDAYTAGVNQYIASLTYSDLPLEYKLLGYQPEKWTNFKSALFLKYMAYDLTGNDKDFEMTDAKASFSKSDFDLLFPSKQDALDPIIPKNTFFSFATIQPAVPAFADSIYFDFLKGTIAIPEVEMPDQFNGSNNWAVDSSKTKSKYPILCSDPHLKISSPSVWYEMQISTPNSNVYGASFPGAPGIIIGFNDSCAFGFTNAGRDVKDYYEIKFKDDSKSEYWFDSNWVNTTRRIEKINIAGKPAFYDTVAYTIFGPVIYDASFSGKNNQSNKNYAVRWSAHDNSNEFKFFYLLNHAKNYSDFQQALPYLKSPGQNCVFACKNGDIALHVQGSFPAKWKGQGEFVMPGFDSSFMWQGMIPQSENPFQFNPARGFVSSANQRPTDSTYPYFIGSNYPVYRGLYLNRKLSSMTDITTADMMKLQTSNYNVFAEIAMPIFLKNIRVEVLNENEKNYFKKLENWGFVYDANTTAASIFELTWSKLTDTIYNDEYASKPKNTARPYRSTLLDALLRDSSYKFIDNITTYNRETIEDVVTAAFKSASLEAFQLEKQNKLSWAKYKDTHVDHLLKLQGFNSEHLKIGGNENCLNATKSSHGPSWRMIVNLTPNTEAYGIYPGGQSGNPGSRFYDNGIDNWAQGNYYNLWMMRAEEKNDSRVKWNMVFSKK